MLATSFAGTSMPAANATAPSQPSSSGVAIAESSPAVDLGAATLKAQAADAFVPLTPSRLLDTRSTGKVGSADGGGAPVELTVAGQGGLPASGLGAVALNVTVVEGENPAVGGGYVTVYPCGTRPDASNLNFTTGQTIPNAVIAPVSTNGTICLYVYGRAHLLADISGYFPTGPAFTPLTPARLLDTRSTGKIGNGCVGCDLRELSVTGRGDVPASGVGAVALNVTVAEGENPAVGGGYVTVYPCGTRPDASNLNFTTGQTIPNAVIAPVSTNGTICLYVYGRAHLLVDVSGYFPGTAVSPNALRFDMAGAAGLALTDPNVGAAALAVQSQAASTANLLRVAADGSVSSAVATGSATVRQFMIAPNGRVYVLFHGPVDLADTSQFVGYGQPGGCVLAEVDPQTGVPTCIEPDLYVSWSQLNGLPNPPIQFDDEGRIYYLGQQPTTGHTVLRRASGGTSVDLINENIQVGDFLVRGDGSVFVTGTTNTSLSSWIRRITPQGGLQTIANGVQTMFMRLFPDGNMYMGYAPVNGGFGVRRYLNATETLDPTPWIGRQYNPEDPAPIFDVEDLCDPSSMNGFCAWSGMYVRGLFTTTDGKVFALPGEGSRGAPLMQYYPTVATTTSQVSSATVGLGVITNVVIGGTDSSGRHMLTVYNTSNGNETVLIPPANEVEIYHLDYRADGNRVMFDGLRFADNTYVIGQVGLASGQVSMVPVGTGRFANFETF